MKSLEHTFHVHDRYCCYCPSEGARQLVLWNTFNTFQFCFTSPTLCQPHTCGKLLNKELSLLSFIFCRVGGGHCLPNLKLWRAKSSQQVLCFQYLIYLLIFIINTFEYNLKEMFFLWISKAFLGKLIRSALENFINCWILLWILYWIHAPSAFSFARSVLSVGREDRNTLFSRSYFSTQPENEHSSRFPDTSVLQLQSF